MRRNPPSPTPSTRAGRSRFRGPVRGVVVRDHSTVGVHRDLVHGLGRHPGVVDPRVDPLVVPRAGRIVVPHDRGVGDLSIRELHAWIRLHPEEEVEAERSRRRSTVAFRLLVGRSKAVRADVRVPGSEHELPPTTHAFVGAQGRGRLPEAVRGHDDHLIGVARFRQSFRHSFRHRRRRGLHRQFGDARDHIGRQGRRAGRGRRPRSATNRRRRPRATRPPRSPRARRTRQHRDRDAPACSSPRPATPPRGYHALALPYVDLGGDALDEDPRRDLLRLGGRRRSQRFGSAARARDRRPLHPPPAAPTSSTHFGVTGHARHTGPDDDGPHVHRQRCSRARPPPSGPRTTTAVRSRPGSAPLRAAELLGLRRRSRTSGTIVVSTAWSEDVADRLLGACSTQRFPIRQMAPVDAFGGSDPASMAADNTSGFNCRNAVAAGTPHGRRTRTARRST